uniref:Uncharacterized protein n=1 Tax=Candidatus Kentrum sp. TC TaxID=2126339 RepID=A0A450ZMS2_9GAMM|nr:MAG: hypothetical protein BECKTC1821F_GA0114240_100664 [Candidatus Kentron sp. TC]
MPLLDSDFVELHRRFAPIGKDEEPNLEAGLPWGFGVGKWLDWSDLLRHRRLVLLAEAASGKTWEFRHRADALAAEGKPAFFVRIEDLADEGFESALDPKDGDAFAAWRAGGMDGEAWFFLDSVDETRLNRKSPEKAVRRFVRELVPGDVACAHVYISCRVSDWKTREDRAMFERLLPLPEPPNPSASTPEDKDAALLNSLFPPKNEAQLPTASEETQKPDLQELLVARLVPLDRDQRRRLAEAWGIEDADAFLGEVERNGLDGLAERPGDMLDLAAYWKEHRRFGSRAEMFEHGVARKLAERDKHRPDNEALSPEETRRGAERLAAALTLGKSFTLLAPGQEPDPELANGAIDPAEVLPSWSDAERNALLRRGVFAPATYGRVRFHHRGTQEYLAARWLHGLLKKGAPIKAVWNLIFAERYGVETLVPSLRAAAAWLALWRDDVRDEIIRREPLVLLGESGDPASFPLAVKEQLLKSYAERDRLGEIGHNHSWSRSDHWAIWMFADPGLADAIRECWGMNDREEFRIDLLGMISAGKIRDCADLARDVVMGETDEPYLREAALDALDACEDAEGLAEAARWLMVAESLEHVLLFHFTDVLYPRHISVDDVPVLLDRHPLAENARFHHKESLTRLWDATPEPDRERLLTGLAELCLAPPFSEHYEHISARHRALVQILKPLGLKAVSALGDAEPSAGLIRLLMAIERAPMDEYAHDEGASLSELVSRDPRLKRALMWADVIDARSGSEEQVTRFWRAGFHSQLWCDFAPEDLDWLHEDFATRPLQEDRQLALSAIQVILRNEDRLHMEANRLRQWIGDDAVLLADLEGYLAPPREYEEEQRRQRQEENKRGRKWAEKKRQNKESWIAFREELEANPGALSDPALLSDWAKGSFRLHHLANWLKHRVKNKGYEESASQWRLLEEGFGRQVAKNYRDGMKALWRITPPERPKHHKNGIRTTKHTTHLSLAGLEIEAGEDSDWAARLTEAKARRAMEHVCLAKYRYPDWLDGFMEQWPLVAAPRLKERLGEEWNGRRGEHAPFFFYHHHANRPIPSLIRQLVLELLLGKAPKHGKILDDVLAILPRLALDEAESKRIARLARRRFRAAKKADKDETTPRYLGMLFLTNPTEAKAELVDWLEGPLEDAPPTSRNELAVICLGRLFDSFQNESLAANVLDDVPVPCLERIIRIAWRYRYVRPEDDYNPAPRDHAQRARDALLNALIDRPGPDAYTALRRLANDKSLFGEYLSTHLDERAHARAEKDAEFPKPWTPAQVRDFEAQYVAPVQSGEGLLRVVWNVLSDIQSDFHGKSDASSRAVLQRAENEKEVQEWLAEQMGLRSKERYHVHREPEASRGNKPDIVISSTAAKVDVALEIKHGGKGWSINDLKKALQKQLAENYLKPEERRHGVLVITYHGEKKWRHPKTKKRIEFDQLIEYLRGIADSIEKNPYDPIQVRVFGLNASEDEKNHAVPRRRTP